MKENNSHTANEIKPGDVVLPPERELRLWMRRHVTEHNLPETALHLHVLEVYESRDKRGPWLNFKAQYDPTWGRVSGFTFKARPETPWTIISSAQQMSTEPNAPGPWSVQNGAIYDAGDKLVVSSTAIEPQHAHLIAAAPELLAACKAAQRFLDELVPIAQDNGFEINSNDGVDWDTRFVIQDAIAKAEGSAR